jgi:signal transduction histidine kinase
VWLGKEADPLIHSIRWRIVLSYIAITLVTVTALGVLGYSLVDKNIVVAETANLESNAQVVAVQALPLVQPTVRLSALDDLARSGSYLADVRVQILSPSGSVLVDSGRPGDTDRLFWITTERGIGLGGRPGTGPMRIESVFIAVPGMEGSDPSARSELSQALRQTIGGGGDIYEYTRRPSLWGPRLAVGESAGGVPSPLVAEPRSDQTVRVPIGDGRNPAGYVQVSESPSLRAAALRTTFQPFLIAAAGAVLLAGAIGLVIGRRLSEPIIALSRTAEQMGAGDLSVRVPTSGKGEIGQLGVEFNRMADRLQATFEQLAEERDTLRRFIGDASHELRTPVTALRSFLELLQGNASRSAKTRAEFVADSLHQVDRLEWITHNLLGLTRLDAGITSLSLEDIRVSDLMSALGAAYGAKAERSGVELVQEAPEEGLELQGDRALLETAVGNLIDNAIKFTPAGGKVAYGANRTEAGFRLWVRDNGKGIDPDDLPHIFDRFYRGRGEAADGSGLGLALVKSIVEAHGGEVRVESDPGLGSQFTLDFPAGSPSDRPGA